ncbi:DUF5519 family protein [Mucilaginibacter sp. 21P]|uniref:luciferase domain-containing protein n=1 Tax=Mucilaginibacter sp. 21P TaxID=2778902 RepID=UPI001C55BDA5|nr:luciferase family protein [Mucilaginibacter sp. 21P]QXV63963.1 DUF5519 family protein [Mucilaginibacter sp. 21P]
MGPSITTRVENIILRWAGTSARNADFGARAFLIRGKEFGHLHPDGTLDIMLGKSLTLALLKTGLVQKHLYVPDAAVTYQISSDEKLAFAISLLRFSYLANARHSIIPPTEFAVELAKLPESLSSINLERT